jgi:hypothetical protein
MSSILDDAKRLVLNTRQEEYGHPADDFAKTAKIWSAILGVHVRPEQVALCMVGLKLSRLVETPDHRDSMVDAAGYLLTYSLVRERKQDASDS